jgi:hypothetical protein
LIVVVVGHVRLRMVVVAEKKVRRLFSVLLGLNFVFTTIMCWLSFLWLNPLELTQQASNEACCWTEFCSRRVRSFSFYYGHFEMTLVGVIILHVTY